VRRQLPPGRGRHALQRQGDGGAETHRDGRQIGIHDPYVDYWYELEEQDTYPSPGGPIAMIDAFGILNDTQIRRY